MAIRILEYQPLTLRVWIYNLSNEVRHADPEYFTLITVGRNKHGVSTNMRGLAHAFRPMDIKPDTSICGDLIFDTKEYPKELIFRELIGTTISRTFPFN